MSRKTKKAKPTIGWREWVALPELGIKAIKAKVDTGARSSSLHAFNVEVVRRRGVDIVRFQVHPIQRDSHRTVEAEGRLVDHRRVRSSSGHESKRLVIVTMVDLLGERWPIEMTLTNRDAMGFRLLLGRQAIRRRFIVDPGRSFLAGRPPRRRKKRKRP